MARSKHFNSAEANPTAADGIPPPSPPLATVIIPTANHVPTLQSVLDAHARQTVPTDIIVVDTSQNRIDTDLTRFDLNQRPTVRFMHIQPQPNAHRCAVIAEALDAATAIATTKYLVYTHDDVWPKNPHLIDFLVRTVNTNGTHAAGYELSDRSHVTDEWRGMLSHTFTLARRLSILDFRLRWNLDDPTTAAKPTPDKPGWPDTETQFGRRIRNLKIPITLIATEPNAPHFEDENLTHRRSLTTHLIYAGEAAIADGQWIDDTIARYADPR